jgi:co-chaperonin GroES (HSP10)
VRACGRLLLGVRPANGLVFIRHVRTEATYPGGKILIPDASRDKVARQQFEVVAVGGYETCKEPEECVRHHNKWNQHVHRLMCGDWVLVKNRAWLATPDPDVFVVRQDAILGKFVER